MILKVRKHRFPLYHTSSIFSFVEETDLADIAVRAGGEHP
jgi:hypothetical protein